MEDLVHFLSSPASSAASAGAVGADQFKIAQGRELYHRIGCVACHAPIEPAAALFQKKSSEDEPEAAPTGAKDLAALRAKSIPLGNLAKKTTVAKLAAFLLDPVKIRLSGRMPSLNLKEAEATAIAMYLLRDQAPALTDASGPKQRLPGVRYEYFEESMTAAPDFDALKVVATGVIDRFDLAPRKRNHQFGLRFTSLIQIVTNGTYKFFTRSDDGSRLYIDDKLVVKNDGFHGTEEKEGSIELTSGEHPIQVTYFQGDAEISLRVSWQGPGQRKREIPASALTHLGVPMLPLGHEELVVDAARAARGRELFAALGCASCHALSGQLTTPSKLQAKPLAGLNPGHDAGCLGTRPDKPVPRFGLSVEQRQALQDTLARSATLDQPLPATDQIKVTMARLNCYACHARGADGGPIPSGRSDYFVINGEADLGDEGRLPPHLTGVGAKLRPEWIGEVLWNKGTARPYMATRMPQFGRENVAHLAALFTQADAPKMEMATASSALDVKWGRKLVGREGLTCISCHRFGKFESLGIPAIDLTVMAGRLRKDWFHRYLIDPASLRPGTRMPSFWPEGQAANTEVLGGDTEKQINAIWAYLSQGTAADVPLGMVRAKKELVATNEPVIYRNFIAGAGSRAIGVGYPEKANLAFDANDVRLALIWQGAFIDASRHGSDRGAGFEPPLGDRVLKMPEGPPFAVLKELDAPWPTLSGKKAGYQFHGYRLDEKRRPAFLYSTPDLRVEELAAARAGELDPELSRTLTVRVTGAVEHLWFRAAVGTKIEAQKDGSHLIDGRLTLRLSGPGAGQPVVRESNGRMELLVPVVFNGGEARIVEEMIW